MFTASICVGYMDRLHVLYDEPTDVLLNVLTQTRTVDYVTRLARSLELLGDEKADVLAAVSEDQLLRLRLKEINQKLCCIKWP